jgi:hypothetical protein
MSFAALVLAQVLRLTDPQLAQPVPAVPDASRYHFAEFADAIDHGDAFRYRLAELSLAIDDAFRYRLAELSLAIDDAFRYRLTEFSLAIDDAFRYRLADFADAIDRFDTFRYHLAEFSDAIDRDVDRCICVTTRLSPATRKSEVLLSGECNCGK